MPIRSSISNKFLNLWNSEIYSSGRFVRVVYKSDSNNKSAILFQTIKLTTIDKREKVHIFTDSPLCIIYIHTNIHQQLAVFKCKAPESITSWKNEIFFRIWKQKLVSTSFVIVLRMFEAIPISFRICCRLVWPEPRILLALP